MKPESLGFNKLYLQTVGDPIKRARAIQSMYAALEAHPESKMVRTQLEVLGEGDHRPEDDEFCPERN